MIWGLKSAGGLDIFSIQGGSNFAGGYFFSGGLGLLKKIACGTQSGIYNKIIR